MVEGVTMSAQAHQSRVYASIFGIVALVIASGVVAAEPEPGRQPGVDAQLPSIDAPGGTLPGGIPSTPSTRRSDDDRSQLTASSDKQDDTLATLDAFIEHTMPTACPSGMVLVGKAGTETATCIELVERSALYYTEASQVCSAAGRHVCTRFQWQLGHSEGSMSGKCNGWEWTGDQDHGRNGEGFLQVTIGAGNCPWQTSWGWSGQHNNRSGPYAYRCCTGTLSSLFD